MKDFFQPEKKQNKTSKNEDSLTKNTTGTPKQAKNEPIVIADIKLPKDQIKTNLEKKFDEASVNSKSHSDAVTKSPTKTNDEEGWTTVKPKGRTPPKQDKRSRIKTPARKPCSDPTVTKTRKHHSPVTEEHKKKENKEGPKPAETTNNPFLSPSITKKIGPPTHNETKNPKQPKQKKQKPKKEVLFPSLPYVVNTKAPASKECFTILKKINDHKPLLPEEFNAPILAEVETSYSKEKNYKKLCPTPLKDRDRKPLLEFIQEATRKTSRINTKRQSKRGAALLKTTIYRLAHLNIPDMAKFPHWDPSRGAFVGNLNEMEKLAAATFDWIGPIPWLATSKPPDESAPPLSTPTKPKNEALHEQSPQEIVANPCAKAHLKKSTQQIKRTPVVCQLKTPAHDSWEQTDYQSKNKISVILFCQALGVAK